MTFKCINMRQQAADLSSNYNSQSITVPNFLMVIIFQRLILLSCNFNWRWLCSPLTSESNTVSDYENPPN